MKFISKDLPINSFLKIKIDGKIQRVFFRDVKHYGRTFRRQVPPQPVYTSQNKLEQHQLNQ